MFIKSCYGQTSQIKNSKNSVEDPGEAAGGYAPQMMDKIFFTLSDINHW